MHLWRISRTSSKFLKYGKRNYQSFTRKPKRRPHDTIFLFPAKEKKPRSAKFHFFPLPQRVSVCILHSLSVNLKSQLDRKPTQRTRNERWNGSNQLARKQTRSNPRFPPSLRHSRHRRRRFRHQGTITIPSLVPFN